ncbi:MAG: hypothetical protein ACXAC5_05235 [Promethearchaeota archaeon]|jgi:hypothetical protein
MKVRSGFVSNSSSSSYLVKVPKNFSVDKKKLSNLSQWPMDNLWESEILDKEGEINQKAVDAVNNELDKLKNGHDVYNGYGGTDIFDVIVEVLDENDCIMMTLDGAGGDGEDLIIAFKDKRKNKI